MTAARIKRVLLVEDNPADVELARRAFEVLGFEGSVQVAQDGVAALGELESAWKSGPDSLPDVVLLDIQMPRLNGFDVLQRVKADARFGGIHVILLTSSPRSEDRDKAYSLRADNYLEKPMRFDQFLAQLKTVIEQPAGSAR